MVNQMKPTFLFLLLFLGFSWQYLLLAQASTSKDNSAAEDKYYKLSKVPLSTDMSIEGGGICSLPDGRIAVATRHGEIWMIENPSRAGNERPLFTKYASGLHEILGLAYRNGSFYCAQRTELTKISDTDGDGKGDLFECVYKVPVSGNYHEFTFGPAMDPQGNMYINLCVGFADADWWLGKSWAKWRGWMVKVDLDGNVTPWAAGLRSPCGFGFDKDWNVCYSDNQGDWVGSGHVTFLNKGDFASHPASLNWSNEPDSPVKLSAKDIVSSDAPLFESHKKHPAIKPPSVWLPHGVLGTSNSEIITDRTEGKFGPFAGQLFVGDQGQSKIMRIFTEKVKGVIQGCAFPFREGFESGVVRICHATDGSLYAAQTARGWASTGGKEYSLQRLKWTGEMPFEIKEVSARPDGFELTFTKPVDSASALNSASYEFSSFTYKYHWPYGSPVIQLGKCPLKAISLSKDAMKVRVVLDSMRQYFIHEIKAEGLKSKDNLPLLHNFCYYTLNEFPEGPAANLKEMKLVANEKKHEGHDHAAMLKEAAKAAAKPKTEKPKTGNPFDALKIPAALKHVVKMPASWTNGPDRTITLGTTPGMRYDQAVLNAKCGEKIRLIFNNYDDMQHNLLIVKPGTADEVGEKSTKLGIAGSKTGYVPASDHVLFHSSLMQPESSESLFFQVPALPGDYQYVCTIPGHYIVMRGVLKVRK